jgi:hypothetical protein
MTDLRLPPPNGERTPPYLVDLLDRWTSFEAGVSDQEISTQVQLARLHNWSAFLAALRWMHSARNTRGLFYQSGVRGHVFNCGCETCRVSAMNASDFEWLGKNGWKADPDD